MHGRNSNDFRRQHDYRLYVEWDAELYSVLFGSNPRCRRRWRRRRRIWWWWRRRLAEAKLLAPINLADIGLRSDILERYREALGDQLLTPAPTLSVVEWKRKAKRRNHIKITDTRLDKAIADDLAWLAKYPASARRVRRPME